MLFPLRQICLLFPLLALPAGVTGEEDYELGNQEYLFQKAESHWAFQPVVKPAVPDVDSEWPRNAIDRFIHAKREAAGIPHAKEASPAVLVRRLYFDLIGLPPTAAEVGNWTRDWSEANYRKLVDHLLASPHYGERWGRYWLDVARYADTKGYLTANMERRYPFAYTYRDWVVHALNEDMPYDEFCRLQIAADRFHENKKADKEDLAALGFLTVGARFINKNDLIIDDRIDVVTRGMLGLTVTCARCHDHMFDPVPTADYYSLYGVFASTEEPKELPAIVEPGEMTEGQRAAEDKLAELQGKLDEFRKTKHAELRTAEKLAKYIEFTSIKKGLPRGKALAASFKQGVFPNMAVRWDLYLAGTGKSGNSVWTPWHAMRPHLKSGDTDAAKTALDALEAANPLVVEAVRAADPQSVAGLSVVYGDLLADADADKPHAGKHREELRLVLRDPGGPIGFGWEEMKNYFDRKTGTEFKKLIAQREKAMIDTPDVAPRAMIVNDRANPLNPVIFNRGDPRNRGAEVPRQFLTVLENGEPQPFTKGSGREELAEKITDRENPLTARVIVNRVWMHHFGNPLVDTPSDFGLQTAEPLHRELLDWLAVEFVARGWSLKQLHRLMVTSSTYRQETIGAPGWEKDIENRYWGRMERRRLGYEATRDALLAVSGELNRAVGGQPEPLEGDKASMRRAIYGHIDRNKVPEAMRTFDFADPNLHAPKREETTVPQQALFFMNSPFVQKRVDRLNELTKTDDPRERMKKIYRKIFARAPAKAEIEAALGFVGQKEEKWEDLIQALIASNEFAFID